MPKHNSQTLHNPQGWEVATKNWLPRYDKKQEFIPLGQSYAGDVYESKQQVIQSLENMQPGYTCAGAVCGATSGSALLALAFSPSFTGLGLILGGAIGGAGGAAGGLVLDITTGIFYAAKAAVNGTILLGFKVLSLSDPKAAAEEQIIEIFTNGVERVAGIMIALGYETPATIEARFDAEYGTVEDGFRKLVNCPDDAKSTHFASDLIAITLFFIAYDSMCLYKHYPDKIQLPSGNYTKTHRDYSFEEYLDIRYYLDHMKQIATSMRVIFDNKSELQHKQIFNEVINAIKQSSYNRYNLNKKLFTTLNTDEFNKLNDIYYTILHMVSNGRTKFQGYKLKLNYSNLEKIYAQCQKTEGDLLTLLQTQNIEADKIKDCPSPMDAEEVIDNQPQPLQAEGSGAKMKC